jgi:hypothetical protein
MLQHTATNYLSHKSRRDDTFSTVFITRHVCISKCRFYIREKVTYTYMFPLVSLREVIGYSLYFIYFASLNVYRFLLQINSPTWTISLPL